MSGADHLSARYTVGHVTWRDRVAIAHAPANAAMPYQLKKETRESVVGTASVFGDGSGKVLSQQAHKVYDRREYRTQMKMYQKTLLRML
jgi:hypothetical protein